MTEDGEQRQYLCSLGSDSALTPQPTGFHYHALARRNPPGSATENQASLNMTPRPEPLLSAQEMARRNNENQAVYRASLLRRRLRKKLDPKPTTKGTKRSKKPRAQIDWQEAESETRPIRAIGFFLPGKT